MSDSEHSASACNQTRLEIQALLYGELGDERRVAVEAHLRECTECHALWQSRARMLEVLDTWREPLPAPRPIRVTRTPATPLRQVLVGALVAAALFALISALGARFDLERGGLTIAFGTATRSSYQPPASAAVSAELEHRVERLCDERLRALCTVLQERLHQTEQRRDRAVLESLELIDRRWLGERLELERQSGETEELRQALAELAILLSSDRSTFPATHQSR